MAEKINLPKNGAAEMFGKLLHSRDVAHLVHLRTSSYAEHVALNEYYDSIVDMTDSLIECYQGCYGILTNISIPSSTSNVNIVEYLSELKMYLYDNKAKVLKDDQLINDVEAIISMIGKTIYKLKNLN